MRNRKNEDQNWKQNEILKGKIKKMQMIKNSNQKNEDQTGYKN